MTKRPATVVISALLNMGAAQVTITREEANELIGEIHRQRDEIAALKREVEDLEDDRDGWIAAAEAKQ